MARQSHKPTEEQRKTVRTMAAFGIKHDEIARCQSISKHTLYKHYDEELNTAAPEANTRVAKSLYQQAINGNTSAAIFWLKARAGWSEKHDVHHSGGLTVNIGYDLSAGDNQQ